MTNKFETIDRDETTGRFLAGNNGGGRKPGARNKLGTAFLDALQESFESHGKQAIERVLKSDPATYLKLVANILPREVMVAHFANVNVNLFAETDFEDAKQFAQAFKLAAEVIGADLPPLLELEDDEAAAPA